MYLLAPRAASLVPFFVANCSFNSAGAESCVYFVAGNDNASAATPLQSYVDGSAYGTCDSTSPSLSCSATPISGEVKGVNTTWTLSNANEAMCLNYVVGLLAANDSQPVLQVPGGKTGEIVHFLSGTATTVAGIGSSTNASCSAGGGGGSGGSSGSSSSSSNTNTSNSKSSATQVLAIYGVHVSVVLLLPSLLVLA